MSQYKLAQHKKLGCFQMKLNIWKPETENAARKLDPSVVAQKKMQFQKVPWNSHGSPIVLMLPPSTSFKCPAVEEFRKLNDEERDLKAAAFVLEMNEHMAGTCQSISGLHRLTALLELGLLDSVTGLVTLYEYLPEQQYHMLGKYYQLLDQSISKHNFAERLAFIWKQSKVPETSATANEWTSMWAELEAYEGKVKHLNVRTLRTLSAVIKCEEDVFKHIYTWCSQVLHESDDSKKSLTINTFAHVRSDNINFLAWYLREVEYKLTVDAFFDLTKNLTAKSKLESVLRPVVEQSLDTIAETDEAKDVMQDFKDRLNSCKCFDNAS